MKKLSDIFILYKLHNTLIKITLSTYKRKKQTIRKNMTSPNNPEQIVNVKIKQKKNNKKQKTKKKLHVKTTYRTTASKTTTTTTTTQKKRKERKGKTQRSRWTGFIWIGCYDS